MEFMNLEHLSEALKEHDELKRSLFAKRAELENLKPPTKPDYIEEAATWTQYEQDTAAYNVLKSDLERDIEYLKKKVQEQHDLIIKAIPGNTWIKVNDRFIGYSTCDWPMYVPILEVHAGKPTKPLKHQIGS